MMREISRQVFTVIRQSVDDRELFSGFRPIAVPIIQIFKLGTPPNRLATAEDYILFATVTDYQIIIILSRGGQNTVKYRISSNNILLCAGVIRAEVKQKRKKTHPKKKQKKNVPPRLRNPTTRPRDMSFTLHPRTANVKTNWVEFQPRIRGCADLFRGCKVFPSFAEYAIYLLRKYPPIQRLDEFFLATH